jgi:hypothetical protein
MATNKLKQLEYFLSDTNSTLNGEVDKKTSEDFKVSDPTYVSPSIEVKLTKEKRQVCRDILVEIRNFGISQRQRLYLIYLLALELENQEAMKAITFACGEHRENIPLTKEDTGSSIINKTINKKKIIV